VKTILREGLVDLWFQLPWIERRQQLNGPQPVISLGWIVAASADVIASVEAFKKAAFAPNCEYGLQLEVVAVNGNGVGTTVNLAEAGLISFYAPFDTPALLGQSSLGDRDEVINLILRDLHDANGEMYEVPRVDIDWTSVS
jgi:hypothetical protein